MFGYDFDRPLRHMDEYLSDLLPLLAGEPAAFTGETLRAHVSLSVPNEERVPLVVAALGPRMLRLAGKRADGTVLWMTGPATVRDHIAPTITAAAAAAGRPSPRVVCVLPVAVTDDVERPRPRRQKVSQIYGTLSSYRAMICEGADGPADLAIIGNEDTVSARLEELSAASVTEFVAGEFMPRDDRTRRLLKSAAAARA